MDGWAFEAAHLPFVRVACHCQRKFRISGVAGASDAHLFAICMAEGRCLVSLDLDFADVLRFPPTDTPGIAVLRLTRGATIGLLASLVQTLLGALATSPIAGRLWVVEPGRIRVHDGNLAAE